MTFIRLNYPTDRDEAEWAPERIEAANAALDHAGIPDCFRRYQEPVAWSRDHDAKWLRFEAAMWRRSYEIALVANERLEERIKLMSWEWDDLGFPRPR